MTPSRVCKEPGCDAPVRDAPGVPRYCEHHHAERAAAERLTRAPRVCAVEGCDETFQPWKGRRYCEQHGGRQAARRRARHESAVEVPLVSADRVDRVVTELRERADAARALADELQARYREHLRRSRFAEQVIVVTDRVEALLSARVEPRLLLRRSVTGVANATGPEATRDALLELAAAAIAWAATLPEAGTGKEAA